MHTHYLFHVCFTKKNVTSHIHTYNSERWPPNMLVNGWEKPKKERFATRAFNVENWNQPNKINWNSDWQEQGWQSDGQTDRNTRHSNSRDLIHTQADAGLASLRANSDGRRRDLYMHELQHSPCHSLSIRGRNIQNGLWDTATAAMAMASTALCAVWRTPSVRVLISEHR